MEIRLSAGQATLFKREQGEPFPSMEGPDEVWNLRCQCHKCNEEMDNRHLYRYVMHDREFTIVSY